CFSLWTRLRTRLEASDLRDEAERSERRAELLAREELVRVRPLPADRRHVRVRRNCLDRGEQLSRLVAFLVADDDVLGAPVEPQRKRQRGEPAREVESAARVPRTLAFRQVGEQGSDRLLMACLAVEVARVEFPSLHAGGAGGDLFGHVRGGARPVVRQVAALHGEVAGGAETRRSREPAVPAGEPSRIARGDERRLLAPHAAPQDAQLLARQL